MKLLNSIIFYLTLNVLLAIVMFVSGFDFTFPQIGEDNEGYYVFYGFMELVITCAILMVYFYKDLFGED